MPKWKPSTAYASGEPVLNPSGQTVTANTAFTSGASYSAANWTVVSGGGGGASYPGATLLVAAANSSAKAKAAADYVCTGTGDDVVINTALTALPAVGGVVQLAEGDYYCGNTGVQILANNQHLWGMGWRDNCRLHVPATATPAQAILVGNGATGNLQGNTVKRLGITFDGYVSRYVKDAVTTSGSPTLTSATAAFVSADTGKTIVGDNIPAATTITYVNATTVTMSNNAIASGTTGRAGLTPTGMTGHGIVASSNMFRVEDVYLASIPQDGISLLSQTTPLEFAEQSIINVRGYYIGRDGISTTADILDLNLTNVRMSGTTFAAGRHGFNIGGGYAHLVNCRANNFFLGDGLHFVSSNLGQVTGGHFDENGGYAATAGNGHGGSGGAGIFADANSRILITGTEFNNNDSFDVYLSSTSNSSVVGTNHDCSGPKGPSVAAIYATGTNNVVIADANIVNPLTRGIVIASSNTATIHDCKISNPNQSSSQASIRMFAVTNCSVHHNTVSNGISEESTSNNNLIEQNYLSGGTVTVVGAGTISIPWLTNPVAGAPVYPWTVAGLLGWSFDEAACASSGIAPIAQQVVVERVQVPNNITISNIVANLVAAGATLTAGAQNVGVVYDSAGNLLGQTADQATNWTTTGVKSMALVTPVAVTGGATKFVYVGVLAGGTTLPQFSRSAFGVNSGPNLRSVRTSSTALTSPPATAGLGATGTSPIWFGVS